MGATYTIISGHRQEALEQARLAAPLEAPEDKATRESLNLTALKQVFNAIKQNDKKTASAIEAFKEFVKSTKPAVMNDNRYYLNLIHLLYEAFSILTKRGEALPRVGREPHGEWYGKLAERFCFEIIGGLERELPPRIRQILRTGLYYVLNKERKVRRALDIDGTAFLGTAAGSLLGVDSYYDDFGGLRRASGKSCMLAVGSLSKLIMSNYSSIQNLLYCEHGLTHRAGV